MPNEQHYRRKRKIRTTRSRINTAENLTYNIEKWLIQPQLNPRENSKALGQIREKPYNINRGKDNLTGR